MSEPMIEKPEDPREEFPECLTVGDLRAHLAEYPDEQIVSLLLGEEIIDPRESGPSTTTARCSSEAPCPEPIIGTGCRRSRRSQ
jgi:hypothetical protein